MACVWYLLRFTMQRVVGGTCVDHPRVEGHSGDTASKPGPVRTRSRTVIDAGADNNNNNNNNDGATGQCTSYNLCAGPGARPSIYTARTCSCWRGID